jgi:hypothetical protein
MKAALLQPFHWSEVVRWTGRTLTVLLFGTWTAFAVGEGLPKAPHLWLGVIGQIVALAIMFAGYALAWRHERAGGLVSLAALGAFYAINLADVGVLPGPTFLLFAVPSVLFLAAGLFARWEHGPS